MQISFIKELAASLASGAAVGYATNSLAVTMLFKKILGRFGGVIESSYEEFVVSMSGLVESDLLNHKTLAEEFLGDKFKNVLYDVSRELLSVQLPKNSC